MTIDSKAYFQSLIFTFAALTSALIFKASTFSLQLDETNTFYVIQGSLSEILTKTFTVQHNSPLHFIIVKCFAYFFGYSELALRLPSLIAIYLSAFLLYRLVAFLSDKPTGVVAALFFLSSRTYLAEAILARTYSTTILFVIYSVYLIITYDKNTSRYFWTKLTITNALIFYGHYFAWQIIPFQLYLLYSNNIIQLQKPRFLLSALATLLLISPSYFHLKYIANKSEHLTFDETPTFFYAVQKIFPLEVTLSLALLLSVYIIFKSYEPRQPNKNLMRIGFFWNLSCIMLIYLASISFFSDTGIFVTRYYIFAYPGLTLLFAGLFGLIQSGIVRNVYLTVLFSFLLASTNAMLYGLDDLRKEIAEYVQSHKQYSTCQMLSIPGYIESKNPNLLDLPLYHYYFHSHLLYYKVPNSIVNLPISVTSPDVIAQRISRFNNDRCLVVINFKKVFNFPGNKFTFTLHLIQELLAGMNFRLVSTTVTNMNTLTFSVYEKN